MCTNTKHFPVRGFLSLSVNYGQSTADPRLCPHEHYCGHVQSSQLLYVKLIPNSPKSKGKLLENGTAACGSMNGAALKGLKHRQCVSRPDISHLPASFSPTQPFEQSFKPDLPISRDKIQHLGINSCFFTRTKSSDTVADTEVQNNAAPHQCTSQMRHSSESTDPFPLCRAHCAAPAVFAFLQSHQNCVTRGRSETCLVFGHTNRLAVLKKERFKS